MKKSKIKHQIKEILQQLDLEHSNNQNNHQEYKSKEKTCKHDDDDDKTYYNTLSIEDIYDQFQRISFNIKNIKKEKKKKKSKQNHDQEERRTSNSTNNNVTMSKLEKILQKMVRKDEISIHPISKNGKTFYHLKSDFQSKINNNPNESVQSSSTTQSNVENDDSLLDTKKISFINFDTTTENKPLCFSEMMRQKQQGQQQQNQYNQKHIDVQLMKDKPSSSSSLHQRESESKHDTVDLDDEIRRLEEELNNDLGSSSSSSSSSSDLEEDDDSNNEDYDTTTRPTKRIKFGNTTTITFTKDDDNHSNSNYHANNDSDDNLIVCMSACASDRITPLPKDKLPTAKSKKLKVDIQSTVTPSTNKQNHRKARRTSTISNDHNSSLLNDGLQKAVKEVLSGYVARSSERLPFYCRLCRQQFKSDDEFILHRQSDFHKLAVQMEQKATYCKLCRKSMTSIVQMQEHLNSKPHREKMDFVKTRQRGHIIRDNGDGTEASNVKSNSKRKDNRQWS